MTKPPIEEAVKAVPPVNQAFLDTLKAEDALGVVVRAHIHVESRLIEFIEGGVPHPDLLRKMGLRYAQRARLACALGLEQGLLPPLLALGEMRNAFSHKLDTALTEQAVANLENAICLVPGSEVERSFRQTKEDAVRLKWHLAGEPIKDRFMICAVLLERWVAAATVHRNFK